MNSGVGVSEARGDRLSGKRQLVIERSTEHGYIYRPPRRAKRNGPQERKFGNLGGTEGCQFLLVTVHWPGKCRLKRSWTRTVFGEVSARSLDEKCSTSDL